VTGARSIFITGAGAGIGAATARLFAARGWRVGAADVNGGAVESLARELGPAVSAHVADVRDPAAVEAALAAFTADTGGQLDAVFANAGVLFMGPDRSITRVQKNLLVDVNVRGVMHTIDAAFPYLARTPGARVVAMSSTSAEYGAPQHAVYSATKYFVRGLTEALDIEYREHGIRVCGIYVAYVQTGMVLDAPVQPATIARLGVRVTRERVAATVWRAVHGRRTHWRVGLDAKLINFAVRLLGGAVRPVVARLARD